MQVTFDGLTGFVAFDSNGRRANYTLMLWETTSYGFQEVRMTSLGSYLLISLFSERGVGFTQQNHHISSSE